MDITDVADNALPSKPRKQTTLEKVREDMQRQLGSRQLQEMQDLVRRFSPEYEWRGFLKQSGPEQQLREMLERTTIPKDVQEMLDGTNFAAQAQRMMGQYASTWQAQHAETLRKVAGIELSEVARAYEKLIEPATVQQEWLLRMSAGLDSVSEAANAYERFFDPWAKQQEWLENLQRQAMGGLSAQNLSRQFELANPAFAAMEAAKNSLDTLWGSFRDIDFSAYKADEETMREAEAAAQSIAEAANGELTLKEAVDQIIAAIQAQQNPTVQLMLFLFFRKVLDWLIAGAMGAVMGYYAPQVLGESPQAASKALKETAREVVGAPELLDEYRYISTKLLIVRKNPRALSPEVSRLTFGKVVKLVKKDKNFALVLWTDKESGAEIQGWVFSRHLGNFN